MGQKKEDRPDWFQDYDKFLVEFKRLVGDPDWRAKAERELHSLRMKSSVASYAATFESLVLDLGWDLECAPVCSMFYHGLSSAIKDELAHGYESRPKLTKDLMNRAIQLDTRLYDRDQERRTEGGTSSNKKKGDKTYSSTKDQRSSGNASPSQTNNSKGTVTAGYNGPNKIGGAWRDFKLTSEGKVPEHELNLREKHKECRACGDPSHQTADHPRSGKGKGAK
jgi:hypothetical protein